MTKTEPKEVAEAREFCVDPYMMKKGVISLAVNLEKALSHIESLLAKYDEKVAYIDRSHEGPRVKITFKASRGPYAEAKVTDAINITSLKDSGTYVRLPEGE